MLMSVLYVHSPHRGIEYGRQTANLPLVSPHNTARARERVYVCWCVWEGPCRWINMS